MSDREAAALLSNELHDAEALLRRVKRFVTRRSCNGLEVRSRAVQQALAGLCKDFDQCIEEGTFREEER